MSNHLSPASVSEHSSYAAGSSHLGASPAPSHHSSATSFSASSSPSPSAKHNGADSDSADYDQPKPVTCRWDNCGKIFYDPEVVYKHLCDDHVGRKSTNNLCLTCRWEGCDVSCAKRDHITSHIRVHTPLKPHNCDVCGKTFKRPQDLKKHERIHTEQHQQQRQHKAAQNAAARAYTMSDHPTFGAYPYPSVHHASHPAGGYPVTAYGGVPPTGHAGLYPSTSSYGAVAYPALPGRDYAHSISSSASLSPMSSRLDTPQGSSPSANHTGGQDAGSYMHLTSSNDGRNKITTDPTSYTYLAHGATTSHNLAGSKRGHEQVEEFFGDLRRKRMAPAYDAHMADRLNQTFGPGGIDDVSLQAIFSTFHPNANAPHFTASQRPTVEQKPADLAQLNAFLLQLGASAARDFGSFSSTASSDFSSSSSSPQHNTSADFDLSSLSQFGLTNIPGFDESLLTDQHAAAPRPIAHLPSRAHEAIGYAQGYPIFSQSQLPASFDTLRASRGVGVVPQLAPMDVGGHNYRRVEALTRAAPDVDDRVRVSAVESRGKDAAAMDEDDQTTESASPRPHQITDRYRSVSPAASSESGWSESGRRGSTSPSHGLYPRVSSADAPRRLPSLGSVLDADTSSRRLPPLRADSDASEARSSTSLSSSSLYPSLVDRVSKMEGLGKPDQRSHSATAEASPAALDAMRRNHVKLIRDLLIAINFPDRVQSRVADSEERIRLPPILTTASTGKKYVVEDDEKTPSTHRRSSPDFDERDADFMREVESDRASTPTPPGRPTLPTLKQLLNDMPEAASAPKASRPMEEREMECDV